MLKRLDSFFESLAINEDDSALGQRLAMEVGRKAEGMTHLKDYEALAAIVLYKRPKLIFEIGTYLGVTSDFFLELVPDCRVVSVAFVNSPRWKFLAKRFNNSGLPREMIGSKISESRRSRFTQIYGDSHQLKADQLITEYGYFDMVFIDGDHSREGVLKDTKLAKKIINDSGVMVWHDANPKPKYMDVRKYLENELPLTAIATQDDYIGGIACWSSDIEKEIAGNVSGMSVSK